MHIVNILVRFCLKERFVLLEPFSSLLHYFIKLHLCLDFVPGPPCENEYPCCYTSFTAEWYNWGVQIVVRKAAEYAPLTLLYLH